jgi:hypothetical protein
MGNMKEKGLFLKKYKLIVSSKYFKMIPGGIK